MAVVPKFPKPTTVKPAPSGSTGKSPEQRNRDAFRELRDEKKKPAAAPKATAAPVRTTTSRSTSSGSSKPKSSITSEQKTAKKNLLTGAEFNTDSLTQQLGRTLANYDVSDAQNRALARVQKQQHSRKTADDRFAQRKKLQAALMGLLQASGNAMEGSGKEVLGQMVATREDLDTGEAMSTLRVNHDAVANALNEALNANTLARRGAVSDAEYQLRGIRSDISTQLGNIDQKLYVPPSKIKKVGAPLPKKTKYKPKANKARLGGYFVS